MGYLVLAMMKREIAQIVTFCSKSPNNNYFRLQSFIPHYAKAIAKIGLCIKA